MVIILNIRIVSKYSAFFGLKFGRNLPRLQNDKRNLLPLQPIIPSTSKLNNTINTSDKNEHKSRNRRKQEAAKPATVADIAEFSALQVRETVYAPCKLKTQCGEEDESDDLKDQTGEHDVVSHG